MAQQHDGKLTDRAIRTLGPGVHRDGRCLYLQVVESGARTWLPRTVVQGRRRWMDLGGFPAVSLTEVRDKGLRCRKIAREGGDPFAERDKDKAFVPNVEHAAQPVFEEHSPSWKNAKRRD